MTKASTNHITLLIRQISTQLNQPPQVIKTVVAEEITFIYLFFRYVRRGDNIYLNQLHKKVLIKQERKCNPNRELFDIIWVMKWMIT